MYHLVFPIRLCDCVSMAEFARPNPFEKHAGGVILNTPSHEYLGHMRMGSVLNMLQGMMPPTSVFLTHGDSSLQQERKDSIKLLFAVQQYAPSLEEKLQQGMCQMIDRFARKHYIPLRLEEDKQPDNDEDDPQAVYQKALDDIWSVVTNYQAYILRRRFIIIKHRLRTRDFSSRVSPNNYPPVVNRMIPEDNTHRVSKNWLRKQQRYKDKRRHVYSETLLTQEVDNANPPMMHFVYSCPPDAQVTPYSQIEHEVKESTGMWNQGFMMDKAKADALLVDEKVIAVWKGNEQKLTDIEREMQQLTNSILRDLKKLKSLELLKRCVRYQKEVLSIREHAAKEQQRKDRLRRLPRRRPRVNQKK